MQIFNPPSVDGNAAFAALAPRDVERLLRIKGDLRLGLPVALVDGQSVALVALIETLCEDRLAGLMALGRPELALTRRRATAIGVSSNTGSDDVVGFAMPDTADLTWLHDVAGRAADVAQRDPDRRLEPLPGTLLQRAAVALAKSEQVLPAALVVPLKYTQQEATPLDLMSMRAEDVLAALAEERAQARVSSARLPMEVSEAGQVHVFRPDDGGAEHFAIEVGTPDLSGIVTVRLHSACFTGDVLGSRKCDCGSQLRSAMQAMAAGGGGVLLYLNQEGRGIGLANKMRAYRLQDAGLDTVEANHWLGFDDDERNFRIGAEILHRLGIRRVRLLTNNPSKIANLAAQGIDVVERLPIHVGRSATNARYLASKAAKSGHLLP